MDIYPQDHLELLQAALEFSELSACEKMHFGCVITDHTLKRLGVGFNQSIRPASCCIRRGVKSGTYHERCYAVHAEQMAALQLKAGCDDLYAYVAGRHPDGRPWESSGFYCTSCVRILKKAGVAYVVVPNSTTGYRILTIEEAIDSAYAVALGEREE